MWSILLLLSLAAVQSPQVSPRSTDQPVPVDREPNHHVVFQNTWVRVIDAAIAPGETTLYHTHAADNVPVCLAGGPMAVQPLGGTVSNTASRTGGVSFAKASYTHRITNTGSTRLHFLDVELLHSPAAALPQEALTAHVPELDTTRVRVFRVQPQAGAPTGDHVHPRPLLRIVVPGPGGDGAAADGPAAGSFRWYAAGEHVPDPPHGVETIEIEVK
jgi:hypothetical protein